MRRNIVLTGFMGTGKTQVGRVLAEKLGYAFVDLDAGIEAEQGMTIREIFEQQGEQRFREIEADMIRRTAGSEGAVIATGGGAVLRRDNLENLRRGGIIVCLEALPETILSRTHCSKARPLLSVEDPLARIRELLAARRSSYAEADIIIDTEDKSPLVVAEEIIAEVESHDKSDRPSR